MNPVSFYKCLAEETRLKCLLLITQANSLCVCQLIDALQLSQPKVSRHLAELRKCDLLVDERKGKWVYYSLSPNLPDWAKLVLRTTLNQNQPYLKACMDSLASSSIDLSKCC